jgi:hypothetical protein
MLSVSVPDDNVERRDTQYGERYIAFSDTKKHKI